jgi:hypothetical protein
MKRLFLFPFLALSIETNAMAAEPVNVACESQAVCFPGNSESGAYCSASGRLVLKGNGRGASVKMLVIYHDLLNREAGREESSLSGRQSVGSETYSDQTGDYETIVVTRGDAYAEIVLNRVTGFARVATLAPRGPMQRSLQLHDLACRPL